MAPYSGTLLSRAHPRLSPEHRRPDRDSADWSIWVEGAYRPSRGRTLLDEWFTALRSTIVGISTVIVIVFFATPSYYSRLIFGYTGVVALVLVGSEPVGRARH